jgi:class I fructose-bisphosphate aldolase
MPQGDVNKILRRGHGMILAYDHGFEHGPTDFNARSVDPAWVMNIANSHYFTAFACQKGIAQHYYNKRTAKVPLIVKLNGKTGFHKDEEPISLQNCSVEEAKQLGATGVGYTIYLGSEHEQQMIKEFSNIEREAHAKGLVLVAWMYPRGKHITNDIDKDILAYAARMSLELGADAVKVKYTGDPESYKWVVKCAGKVKVFVVGGSKVDTATLQEIAKDIKAVGAVGFAIGRNIWQADDPIATAKSIADVLYG